MKVQSVLIVDDDRATLKLLMWIIERENVHVECAASGEEAVEILKKAPFAIMITDLNMAAMNGYELAVIAKELSPGMDIIMMTADISPEVDELAAEAGIASVLPKPCGAENIRRVVWGKIAGAW